MSLSAGIVGLPNAGKSTLFNALTHAGALVGNYPFSTVDPNSGTVPVPDDRLGALAAVFSPPKIIPTSVTFIDIAGLVRGASKGEGLGNQFLGHIRAVDAMVLVVRAFDDGNVIHVEGTVDPVRDVDIIETELLLADLEVVMRRRDKTDRNSRLQKEKSDEERAALAQLVAALEEGTPLRVAPLTQEARELAKEMSLLTSLPMIVVANVSEEEAGSDIVPDALRERATKSGARCLPISARIESEISELEPEEQTEFLTSVGLTEPGLRRLARETYDLLSLCTFFTAGEKEVRAWTVVKGATAVDAAGTIHTDFAKGFIRAEVVDWHELVDSGSYASVRDKGRLRVEGRDYTVVNGDVMHFRFNV